jgi:hypothetical protein
MEEKLLQDYIIHGDYGDIVVVVMAGIHFWLVL